MKRNGRPKIILITMAAASGLLAIFGGKAMEETLGPGAHYLLIYPAVIFLSLFLGSASKFLIDKALHESERQFRGTFENAAVGFANVNLDGRYIQVNQRFCDILGYTKQELLGRVWQEITYHEDLADDLENYSKLQSGLINSYQKEKRYVRKDGSIICVMLTVSVQRNDSGNPEYYIGVIEDITCRKKKEEELYQLNRTFKALRDSNQAITRIENESDYLNEVCKIIVEDCGHAMVWIGFAENDDAKAVRPVAYAGFEEEYIKSLNITWADTERGRGPVGTAVRTSKPNICRNVLTDPRFHPWRQQAIKSGYGSLVALPLLSLGKPFGAITIYSKEVDPFSDSEVKLLLELAHDLAYGIMAIRLRKEHREAEAALKRSQEILKEEDRRKDQFLAILAHELRNPLAAIKGATTLFRMPDLEISERVSIENMVEHQADQLMRLIDDLLDVSRITQGKIKLQMEPFRVSEAIEHAVRCIENVIKERGHKLTVEITSEDMFVKADPVRFEQILVNLLTNAAKYTDPGGCIGLKAVRKTNLIEIKVQDTGMGISPEMLPRVFELFIQSDDARKKSVGGLGIGLSIVKKLVEMHGGTITAASEGLGKGADFTVVFPAIDSSAFAPDLKIKAQSFPLRSPNHGLRILVVDDNEELAMTMGHYLRALSHQVFITHSGAAGIEMAYTCKPQAILLDIRLPDMTGYEVAVTLKNDPLFKDTLLIAVTGFGQDEDRDRSYKAGFDYHFVKPVDYDELAETFDSFSNRLIKGTVFDSHVISSF